MACGERVAGVGGSDAMDHQITIQKHREREEKMASLLLTLTNTTWILGCHPQYGARVYKGIYEYEGSLENNLFYPQAHK